MSNVISDHEFKAHPKHTTVCNKCGQSKERHREYTTHDEWTEALQQAVKTNSLASAIAAATLEFFENYPEAVAQFQAEKTKAQKKTAKAEEHKK